MGTDVDQQAVKATAMAKVLVECFSDEERRELMAEAIKPYFAAQDCGYGKEKTSLFADKVTEALGFWATVAVREYFAKPDIRASIEARIEEAFKKALDENLVEWVKQILAPSPDKY